MLVVLQKAELDSFVYFLKNGICTLTYENNLGESTRETVNYGREIEGLYLWEKTS